MLSLLDKLFQKEGKSSPKYQAAAFDPDQRWTRVDVKEFLKQLKIQTTSDEGNRYLLTDLVFDCSPIPAVPVIRNLDGISPEKIRSSIFYIYFNCDSDALLSLRKIVEFGGKFIPHKDFSKTQYRFINRLALNALKRTDSKNKRISHFDVRQGIHENICEALEITKNLQGDYLEIGVYKGGSALTAVNYLDELNIKYGDKFPRKKAWLLDTYDGFTYEVARESSDVIWADTHVLFGVRDTIQFVGLTFSDINIECQLIINNICTDPLPEVIQNIAVANIDVDIYDATKDALIKVSPKIVHGGIIICEDPTSTPGLYGAFLAMENFLESNEGSQYIKIFKGGQYFLLKTSNKRQ